MNLIHRWLCSSNRWRQTVEQHIVPWTLDGVDLCADEKLWLGEINQPTGPIGKSVRIGITRAADKLLRFFERDNPFVSGPKHLNHSIPRHRKPRPPSA